MPIITETFRDQVEDGLKKMQHSIRAGNVNLITLIDRLSHGKTIEEVADEMFSSPRTMENRVNELKKLFRAKNVPELCCTAMRLKLIE